MLTDSKPGLYVHVPFCRKKCPYCGFFSIASPKLISIWINALEKEIDFYSRADVLFDSLYLGGGTPTILDIRDMERIIVYIFKNFSFTELPEITIEANPNDLIIDKIIALKKMGFNRINVGAQSFDDNVLSFLGRTHKVTHTERGIDFIRSSGFDNVGIDLIYGFGQLSMGMWKDSLKKALEFEPEHLSCYQLSYEKGTVFWRMKDKLKIKLPNEEEESLFFIATSEFLKENGYFHYEVSNYAKGREFISRHNSKYWKRTPYLGLGPSAHSFDGKRRWWNCNSLKRYCHSFEEGALPIDGFENISEEQKRLELITLGMRSKQGFHIKEICEDEMSLEALSRLQSLGFLTLKNSLVVPTTKGFLVADYIPLYLSG